MIMKLINMSCPNCGAALQVNPELKQAQCNYCGNLFYMDDEVQHIQFDNAEDAGYLFEKGRQRAEEDKKTVNAAKLLLMNRNHMTEPEAYRFIQKTSMDTGRTMLETAQMILLFERDS